MLLMLILSSLLMTKYPCNYYTFQKCFQNTIWTKFCKSFCSDLPPSASHSKDRKPGQAVQGVEDCLSPGDDQRGTSFQISNSNCICLTRKRRFESVNIIYSKDNAITKIENLHRLKSLEYINLAMNAIEVNILKSMLRKNTAIPFILDVIRHCHFRYQIVS